MPVSGREIASLDFANLIGGPLDAIVRTQAKSAITTANFIKEVGFDKDGKLLTVDFKYNKKNDAGKDQEFTLTVPFITMLPVPYISIYEAVIDFNAKITSTTQTQVDTSSESEGQMSGGGKYWFFSVNVTGKTSTKKKTSYTDQEERTFDMHVRVEARNQDMPAGTDRLLTILEEAIGERKGPKIVAAKAALVSGTPTALSLDASVADLGKIKANYTFEYDGVLYKLTPPGTAPTASPAQFTVAPNPPAGLDKQTIQIALPE